MTGEDLTGGFVLEGFDQREFVLGSFFNKKCGFIKITEIT